MTWFQKLFGAKSRSRKTERVTAEECLAVAGWVPGRTCDIAETEHAFERFGFRLHDKGREFLREYQGLAVDVPIDEADGIKGFVHFAPDMALRLLGPSDKPRLDALMPEDACPIGTTGGHTVLVFMDGKGRSYLLDMEWTLFAELATSPGEMVEALCGGRNGRVDSRILDDLGHPTGELIRNGDERRHWRLDQFPVLSRFLPPVSLSPARRPPTWRAMARAAEQALAKGGSPDKVLVTCGGFTSSPSGQTMFVAHCENCLYVRAKAGLQAAAPPPGVLPGFRVGEVIPFQPPPGW